MNFEQRMREIRHEPSSDAPGDPERLRRIALTKTEMMTQGEAIGTTLAANAEHLALIGSELANRSIRKIAMVGCGDSWIAGIAVRHAMERLLGAAAEPCEAFDFATYGLEVIDADTVVIGLSSSGKTKPVIDGLKGAAARGAYVIGLSNTHGSPLMEEFQAALHVRATRAGWPTQSSTAAMALMLALAASVGEARGADASALRTALKELPSQVDAVAQGFYGPAQEVARRLARADLVLLTGAGPYLAAAEVGSAKLGELAPIPRIRIAVGGISPLPHAKGWRSALSCSARQGKPCPCARDRDYEPWHRGILRRTRSRGRDRDLRGRRHCLAPSRGGRGDPTHCLLRAAAPFRLPRRGRARCNRPWSTAARRNEVIP